jgi:hypothetical protein
MSGCRIDAATAAHIPESVIGRVLSRPEAMALLVPKKPPAPSLTRDARTDRSPWSSKSALDPKAVIPHAGRHVRFVP